MGPLTSLHESRACIPAEFLTISAKRLLQHNRPKAALAAPQPNVRCWGYSDRHSSGGVFGGK